LEQQLVVLTNPFPHGKNMPQASTSLSMAGDSQGAPVSIGNTSTANVYMLKSDAHIVTRSQYYGMLETIKKGKEATNPSVPLQIEKKLGETMARIPKGLFNKNSHNTNTRAAQNYSVVEDLAQTPCAMSYLEVLQSCPS